MTIGDRYTERRKPRFCYVRNYQLVDAIERE
jgi:hypothetical protein